MVAKERRNKQRLDADEVLANVGEISDEELREIMDELYKEEETISLRRRVLHGKIDILRAELVERLKKKRKAGESIISGEDIERLTDILAQGMDRKPKPKL